MRLLVLAAAYPHAGHAWSGVFNERCVIALKELGHSVEVLAPRPYAPVALASWNPRWKAYRQIPALETRSGVPVYRPAYLQIPGLAGGPTDLAIFLASRRIARNRHERAPFEAILSFDLGGTGGLAWRLRDSLGLPTAGWAFGSDVRVSSSSPVGRSVVRALSRLDVVFYQSRELKDAAAVLWNRPQSELTEPRHVVLAHGIQEPPEFPREAVREDIRARWGAGKDDLVVLYVGRITRAKGAFDLLTPLTRAMERDSRVRCVFVGSTPAFDETDSFRRRIEELPDARGRISLLPGCEPDEIWRVLCGADIFVFASHNEGMPNSLLEAMAMGVPAVAFGIPPVVELENGTGALSVVPPLDLELFGAALEVLVSSPEERRRLGAAGREQVMRRFLVKRNIGLAVDRLRAAIRDREPSARRSASLQAEM